MKIHSKKYPIPNQLPGEKVIYFIHRHWFIFVKIATMLFFLILIPLIIYLLIILRLPKIWELFSGPLILFLGIYLLLIMAFGLVSWMNYFFDILIITNRRIIEIEQRTLFNRAVFAVEIIHVEDVSVEVKGIFATFFSYGNIEIQTAGASRNFIFQQIPNPYVIAREISTLYNRLAVANNHKNSNHHKISQAAFSSQTPKDDELSELKKIKK